MIATPRIQRRYDHRLQAMVKSAGSIEIALEQVPAVNSPAAARLADLQERIAASERRTAEMHEQEIAMSPTIVDLQDVAKAMRAFDPIWESLTPLEQVRIVHLLVERVDDNGETGKIAITFHNSGIKTLAYEISKGDAA